ncbi:UNVERIFIED_CONTAM: hypothetical protein FKN15_068770 [Acipenser sinensis]
MLPLLVVVGPAGTLPLLAMEAEPAGMLPLLVVMEAKPAGMLPLLVVMEAKPAGMLPLLVVMEAKPAGMLPLLVVMEAKPAGMLPLLVVMEAKPAGMLPLLVVMEAKPAGMLPLLVVMEAKPAGMLPLLVVMEAKPAGMLPLLVVMEAKPAGMLPLLVVMEAKPAGMLPLLVVMEAKPAGKKDFLGAVSDVEMQEHYDEFFEEVFTEMEEKYGEVEEMNVCDNLGDHLVGNVYVKFRREEDAEKAVMDLNNRWFNGQPIHAELSPVTDFREACCRQYEMGNIEMSPRVARLVKAQLHGVQGELCSAGPGCAESLGILRSIALTDAPVDIGLAQGPVKGVRGPEIVVTEETVEAEVVVIVNDGDLGILAFSIKTTL